MPTETQTSNTQDIEYLSHGDAALKLRLFRPSGAGLFPAVVDLHGGAWCKNDLSSCQDRDEALTEAGFAVAALDFRHAADAYPSSLIDINYAIRWIKAHCKDFGIDPDRIGISGQSSGGHLAMLSAMRPHDARFSSIALPDGAPPVDASVRCVGMSWPVMNPYSRYRHALRERENAAAWVGDIPESHDLYWKTDENMSEGNPTMALERGESLQMPPALWVQGRPDPVHDYLDPESELGLNEPERFAHGYRGAGGNIEVVYIDQENRYSPTSFGPVADFFSKHLK